MFFAVEVWEDEGGSLCPPRMSGSEAQVEWAERLRRLAGAEFDRVDACFRSVALQQTGETRADTETILAVLAEKRAETMGIERAAYFIREWQEIGDQVRKLIAGDPRYQTIRRAREAREATGRST
jgi:hypothetical protein